MDYHKLAKDIVDKVGGKENVTSVTHCMTRLRFVLKDVGQAKKDEAFASGALGKGVAFKLADDFICAPANGKISAMFPTGHAFGITTKSGAEILVHIGINTVELQGNGFDVLAKQDEEVRAGQPIVRVDRKAIMAKGYDLTTMLVITNPDAHQVELKTSGTSNIGDVLGSEQ